MKSFDGREQINDKQGETINFLLISTVKISQKESYVEII